MAIKITLDFETRSVCDLKKSGAYKYSLHPTSRATCLSIRSKQLNQVIFLKFEEINCPWRDQPEWFKNTWQKWIRNGYLFSAHNAFFEICIYKNILVSRYDWPDIPFSQWRCTAAKAAACALPRSLEGAGAALHLAVQKDKTGYVAMMTTCKPTKKWNAWCKKGRIGQEPSMFLEPGDNPDIWKNLYHYCKIDTAAEELLDESLPDLTNDEQEVWALNIEMNWRGIRIDVPTIEKVSRIIASEKKTKLRELDYLTLGLVTKAGARQSILDFLKLEGIELPDIRAKTVDDVLKEGKASPDAKRLLELRKALGKASTGKYRSFLERVNGDDRVRDLFLYHGASTGRDTGIGIQIHNFPKNVLSVDPSKPYAAVENVSGLDVETLHLLYGDNLSFLFSHILRNMILPSEGYELFVGDYSKIEVAVLWWLAGNRAGLRVLESGKDPYIYQASLNLRKSYAEIERAVKAEEDWAINARQLGKAQVLGSGFGMGHVKFQSTAWSMYRLKLNEHQSKKAIENYRKGNPSVPALWRAYENAAVSAVQKKGRPSAGMCKFQMEGKFLKITLPSGRKLSYLSPKIAWRETDYGPRAGLEFLGVAPNKKSVQWERTWGGTLTENVVQAVARDLLMFNLVNLEKKGHRVLFAVHDEGAIEVKKESDFTLDEFTKLLCTRPPWADELLPIEAKAWSGPRYRK